MIRALLLALALLVAVPGCGGAQRVAHVSVVALGSALSEIHRFHQAAYTQATDALVARLAAEGGTLEDYDREVAPIDAAFRARSAVIADLSAQLYAAAAVIDAARQGASMATLRPVAARVLEAVDRAVNSLRRGDVLAPVAIPGEVSQVLGALQILARGGR